MKYKSTRGSKEYKTSCEAIIKGIAEDGGLYVPESMPKLEKDLAQLIDLPYNDLAYEILKLFLTDFSEAELKYCIEKAYDEKFDTEIIAPIVKKGGDYFLELFHGKTLAFKDMALSIHPYLLKTAAKKLNLDKKIVILTATSGDTGKAALEGFKNIEDISVIVFYPKDGVSEIQKKQMTTTDGNNTFVFGVDGNFDDTQTAVKEIFNDTELTEKFSNKGYLFSSANSINIGRLLPQIVYYFYAYAQMVKNNYIEFNEKINFTVPTGNFGNILAGYFAKQLGLPINKLICASNRNKVLYDFFKDGVYDKNREFYLTSSPSMDIIISSNLERLIYLLSDENNTKNSFDDLKQKGKYEFKVNNGEFETEFATDEETAASIKELFEQTDYIMDTHTSVAYTAYKKYKNASGDKSKNVILSTASPYKFPQDVLAAIDSKYKNTGTFELLDELSKLSGVKIPESLVGIEKKPDKFINITKSDMKKEIEKIFI